MDEELQTGYENPEGATYEGATEGGDPNASDVVTQGESGTGSGQTSSSVPAGYIPQKDMDALRSIYDKRINQMQQEYGNALSTIQARLAQEAQARAAYERQLYEMRIAQMPKEQQSEAKRFLEIAQLAGQMQAYKQQVDNQLLQEKQHLEQIKAQYEPIARSLVIDRVAKETGIPKPYLDHVAEKYNNPVALRAAAEVLRLAIQATNAQNRQGTGQDAHVGMGAGAGTFDTKPFEHTGKLEDYIRALQKSGRYYP